MGLLLYLILLDFIRRRRGGGLSPPAGPRR